MLKQRAPAMQAWCDYEVAALQKLANRPTGEAQAPGPAALGANKMFDPYRLIWRQLLAGMHGLKSGLGLGMSVGQDEIVDLPHLKDPGDFLPVNLLRNLPEVQCQQRQCL